MGIFKKDNGVLVVQKLGLFAKKVGNDLISTFT